MTVLRCGRKRVAVARRLDRGWPQGWRVLIRLAAQLRLSCGPLLEQKIRAKTSTVAVLRRKRGGNDRFGDKHKVRVEVAPRNDSRRCRRPRRP